MNHRSIVIFAGAFSVLLLLAGAILLRLDLGEIPVPMAKAEGEILSPVNLTATERMVIDYESAGCRHHWKWRFEIGGSPERPTIVLGSNQRGTEPEIATPATLIDLSAADCRALENLLRYYRQPNPHLTSTTTNTIRVSYFRGTQKIGSEVMVEHATVEYWVDERSRTGVLPEEARPLLAAEVLTLPQLAKRITEPEPSREARPL